MVLEGLCAAKAAERLTEDDRDQLRAIGSAMQAVSAGDLLGYSELNKQLHALVRTLAGQTTARSILERLRGQNVRHQFQLAMHRGRPSVSLLWVPESRLTAADLVLHTPRRRGMIRPWRCG